MQSSVEMVAASGHRPEPATVEDALMVAMARVGRRLRQRLPGDELDFPTLMLLKTVAHLGPLRVSAIAAELDLDASTVSRHVKALEDRDLLERGTDPDDGRASRVAVSAHGAASIEASATRRRELIGSLLADWSDADRESLRRLLHQLSLSLESTVHHS